MARPHHFLSATCQGKKRCDFLLHPSTSSLCCTFHIHIYIYICISISIYIYIRQFCCVRASRAQGGVYEHSGNCFWSTLIRSSWNRYASLLEKLCCIRSSSCYGSKHLLSVLNMVTTHGGLLNHWSLGASSEAKSSMFLASYHFFVDKLLLMSCFFVRISLLLNNAETI